jgi:nickel transport protein
MSERLIARVPPVKYLLPALMLSVLLCIETAYAHKVHVFATAEGSTISGCAYSSGGGPLKNTALQIRGPGGGRIGETRTDENGNFTFLARRRCDHELVVETVDGHRASFTVKADDLPVFAVSGGEGPLELEAGEAAALEEGSVPPHAGHSEGIREDCLSANIEKAAAGSASRQIRSLRRQLRQAEEKVRMRDVIGGIGYLVGITGIVFYILGRRKTGTDRPDERSSGEQS